MNKKLELVSRWLTSIDCTDLEVIPHEGDKASGPHWDALRCTRPLAKGSEKVVVVPISSGETFSFSSLHALATRFEHAASGGVYAAVVDKDGTVAFNRLYSYPQPPPEESSKEREPPRDNRRGGGNKRRDQDTRMG